MKKQKRAKSEHISHKIPPAIIKVIYFPLPFIVGFIGFILANETPLQAIYASLCLYGMGQKDLPPNMLVEIARWVAPLCTLSFLIMIVKTIGYYIRARLAYFTGKSVAVYGPADEKEAMLKKLGKRGIDITSRPMKANSYILLHDDETNLSYYHTHLAEYKAPVFAKSTTLPSLIGDGNLQLFHPEETAARIFWREHSPYREAVESAHRIDIALIGFGSLGRSLLISGLQNNIFSPDQIITYHIFGDEGGFSDVHHRLSEISDPVNFYEKPWYKHLSVLSSAKMIIVSEQKDQIALLSSLTMALPGKKIHVLSAGTEAVKLMASEPKLHNLVILDWKSASMDPDAILEDETFYYAKRINLRYSGIENGSDSLANERWAECDTFDRMSNVRAADFKHVADRILDGRELTPEILELLAELEHIRWCRYHFLSNWQKGEPIGGESRNKNKTERVHRLLCRYSELTEDYREIDRNNVRILLDLFRTTKDEKKR